MDRHIRLNGAWRWPVLGRATVSVAFLLMLCADAGTLRFSAAPDNDLWVATQNSGLSRVRYATPREAVASAARGDGVVLLADGYTSQTTPVDAVLLEAAAAKGLRLYLEYPSFLAGQTTPPARTTRWERGVVASEFFAPALGRLQLLALHDCRFLPLAETNAHLVLARVAGFAAAVYGLPPQSFPLLFEQPNGSGESRLLVAATKLSQFRTGRYGPAASWSAIWERILVWLQPQAAPVSLN